MKKKTIYLVLFIAVVAYLMYFAFWLLHCKNFQEVLHVNFSQLALQLKGESGQDYGVPLFITRLFHNKLVDGFLLIIKTYFKFWDFIFFGELFPFIGGFGILAAGYYFFDSKTKRTRDWMLFLLFLILPFMELFLYQKILFIVRISLFYLVFGFISLLGIKRFVSLHRWSFAIIIILAIVSIWWLLIADFHLANFCYQYPLV
jgi:hypothetical protein